MEVNISLEDICVPSADIVSQEIDDNLVVISLLNGVADAEQQIYTLNKTGQAIWYQLDGKNTLGQVADELSNQFGCPLKDIERDVLGITKELLRWGICQKLNEKQFRKVQLKKNIDEAYGVPDGSFHDKAEADEDQENYIAYGGELSLSNFEQLVMLDSMAERDVPLRIAVRGFSMQPFIRDQDVLTIMPLNDHQLHIGEVVAFSHPESGKLIIHRIINKTDSGWLLKGDNSSENDGIVITHRIIGYIGSIERDGREVKFGMHYGTSGYLIACLSKVGLIHIGLKFFLQLLHTLKKYLTRG